MNKTKWMSTERFFDFVAFHQNPMDGLMYCAACEASEKDVKMTVDHIRPRIQGGTDDTSNLQPLCTSCNSRKHSRPDAYWGRRYYFDGNIDKSRLRASQSDFVMGAVENTEDFFGRPYSTINRKLFTFVQTVGAGKTLGMFALPFAINTVAEENAPRIDKVLIVTKDKSLRDQLARELVEEPLNFGIVTRAPTVLTISGSQMMSDNSVPHDIAVMCPNMLWPRAEGNEGDNAEFAWHPFAEQMMARYPLIIFDEMHYAYANIDRLIKVASNSLVFGFTASPIDEAGELLEDMVLMSVFGYDAAQINDGSMKFINFQQENLNA